MNHCDDFSRAELLRQTFASAGRGLPAIERGMPVPAGTGLSRRSFLARTGGLALTVFGASALGPQAFNAGIEEAAAASGDRILVSIFMPGGLDSLSLLAPVNDPAYAALRPSLAIRPADADRFGGDGSLYWNPVAAPLRDLHARGRITMIPAIGYASPDQSHFTSRHYWEVGELSPQGRIGWLGRYLDQHGTPDNPLQGLALSNSLAPVLAASDVPVAAVSDPANTDLWTRGAWGLDQQVFDALDAMGGVGAAKGGDLRSAGRALGQVSELRDRLAPMRGAEHPYGASVAYPESGNAFPRRLAALAGMVAQGMPLRCVALNANGGYDTHDNQGGTLDRDLGLFAQSLAAFQADLEARGVADRVLVHVWSEFGRRAKENGTGTDHGAGGVSFLMGTRASGQTIEGFPGLGSGGIDKSGNLVSTADFRGVYASLLEQWFGVDAAPIVPGAQGFKRYPLVRA